MQIYKTRAGDTFDLICYEQLGSSKYLGELLKANPDKLQTFVFSANEELNLPEISTETVTTNLLPAWYR